METPVPVGWDYASAPTVPRDLYAIHDWNAVEEAVKLYSAKDVDLAIHPNASLRFANEFIKELKTGLGASAEGYLVINPEIAFCKAEMFDSLYPHVKALGDWAVSIGSEVDKVHAVVRDMMTKYNDAADRNIFPVPVPEAVVHEPIPKTEPVYLQLIGKRGLDLIDAPARRHISELPEKCTTMAEIASSQPSEAAAQTELYKLNLQFLQEKLKLLGSFEDQIKKIHMDMHELLLGSTSVGSARTVMDFVDVDLMQSKEIETGDNKSQERISKRKSPVAKDKNQKSPKFSPKKSPVAKDKNQKSPKFSPKKKARAE